jgi:hypothetical protein
MSKYGRIPIISSRIAPYVCSQNWSILTGLTINPMFLARNHGNFGIRGIYSYFLDLGDEDRSYYNIFDCF